MPAGAAILQTLYSVLTTDATLRGLLADDFFEASPSMPAVYSKVPQPPLPENEQFFPYILIGDDVATAYDMDDTNGEDTIVTLHVFDWRRTRLRAKQVRDAVKLLLHNSRLSIPGTNFIFCFFESSTTVPDPEPMVQHETIRFRIVTMDS